MDADRAADGVIDVIEDDYAQEILRMISEEPRTGPELVEAIDASKPTVYRRLSMLEEQDMVETATDLDPDGHHRTAYRLAVSAIHIDIQDGSLEVSVEREPTAADRFTRAVDNLK